MRKWLAILLLLIPLKLHAFTSSDQLIWFHNFEHDDYGVLFSSVDTSGSPTYDVSTTYAHSGSNSMKIDLNADGEYVHMQWRNDDDTGTNLFTSGYYTRMWIYMSTALEADFADDSFIACFGFLDSGFGIEWYVGLADNASNNPKFFIGWDSGGTEETSDIAGDITVGWHCLEVYFLPDTDGTDGVIKVWYDGDLTNNETGLDNHAQDCQMFVLGNIDWWSNEITSDIYYDDIVISTDYVGPNTIVIEGGAVGSEFRF